MFTNKIVSKSFLRFYSKPKCGFIGLGNMGSNMAPHLLEKGAVSELNVFDLNQDSVNRKMKKKNLK
jgi:3-hydroxyisobutyrate dehydrogenase-like beta-hydroxyacid dehydrogenase